MKQPETPFRLFDFLAYLFPGMVTIHLFYILMKGKPTTIIRGITTGNSVIDVSIFLAGSYIIGLSWSVFTRFVVRPLTWKISNPRIDFFEGTDPNSPLGETMTTKLQELAKAKFGDKSLNADIGHRLCREYISINRPETWNRREEIKAVRSMCANSIGPAILYAFVFASKGWWFLCIAALFTALALSSKMITLDTVSYTHLTLPTN